MKKLIIVALVLVLGLLGYVAAGPFLTMGRISNAVTTRDANLLGEAVDFESLRAGLTEQFSARLVAGAGQNMQDNPFAALAVGFASTVVEKMVSAIVTPSGVIRIIDESSNISHKDEPRDDRGEPEPAPGPDSSPQPDSQPDKKQKDDVFAGADFHFHGHDRFSATIGSTEDNTTRFVFRRDGLQWRLSNILLPKDVK